VWRVEFGRDELRGAARLFDAIVWATAVEMNVVDAQPLVATLNRRSQHDPVAVGPS